jgi:hypothetical protein
MSFDAVLGAELSTTFGHLKSRPTKTVKKAERTKVRYWTSNCIRIVFEINHWDPMKNIQTEKVMFISLTGEKRNVSWTENELSALKSGVELYGAKTDAIKSYWIQGQICHCITIKSSGADEKIWP